MGEAPYLLFVRVGPERGAPTVAAAVLTRAGAPAPVESVARLEGARGGYDGTLLAIRKALAWVGPQRRPLILHTNQQPLMGVLNGAFEARAHAGLVAEIRTAMGRDATVLWVGDAERHEHMVRAGELVARMTRRAA